MPHFRLRSRRQSLVRPDMDQHMPNVRLLVGLPLLFYCPSPARISRLSRPCRVGAGAVPLQESWQRRDGAGADAQQASHRCVSGWSRFRRANNLRPHRARSLAAVHDSRYHPLRWWQRHPRLGRPRRAVQPRLPQRAVGFAALCDRVALVRSCRFPGSQGVRESEIKSISLKIQCRPLCRFRP